jgi:MFS family permease
MTGVAAAPAAPVPRPRGPWGRPDFRRLWYATTVSQVGTQVSELALPLTAIALLRASPVQIGALAAAGYLPLATFGLPAGAWADRLRRRSVLVVSDLARAAVLGSVPVAYTIWHVTMLQLYVVALLVAGFSVFFDAAYPAYLPSVVERSELARGNARLQVSEQGAAVVGPGIAGWLIGLVGAPLAVAVDAGSYLGSAAFISRIRHREPPPVPRVAGGRMRTDIAQGLRHVMADPHLRAIAVASGLINLFGRMVVVVVLIYLVRSAGYSAVAIGIVFAAGSVGFLVGAAIADRVFDRIGLGRSIVVGGTMAAAPFLLIAAPSPSVAGPFVAAALFVYGVGALTFSIGSVTLRQLTVPSALLGRVTASIRLLAWIAQPIAGVLGGALAAELGLHRALWVGAVGALSAPIPLFRCGLFSTRPAEGAPPSEGAVRT